MNLSAVILAGGQSRRMGQDKAWLDFGGRPLIAHAVEVVRDLGVTEIFISGRAGVDYSALGCPVVPDREPGAGPLAGIEAGFAAIESPLLLVLAVDLPNMTAAFLRKLADGCDSMTGAVPELKGGLEPLAAIYPKRCHEIVQDCLLKNRRSARDFATACLGQGGVRKFPVLKADKGCFTNWNTPSDVSRGRVT